MTARPPFVWLALTYAVAAFLLIVGLSKATDPIPLQLELVRALYGAGVTGGAIVVPWLVRSVIAIEVALAVSLITKTTRASALRFTARLMIVYSMYLVISIVVLGPSVKCECLSGSPVYAWVGILRNALVLAVVVLCKHRIEMDASPRTACAR